MNYSLFSNINIINNNLDKAMGPSNRMKKQRIRQISPIKIISITRTDEHYLQSQPEAQQED